MRTVLAIALNQLLRLAADRGALVMLVLFPLTLNFILGVSLQKAFSPDFRPDHPARAALVVADGPLPSALAEVLTGEELSALLRVERVADPDEARQAVLRRRVDAAVIIPADLPDAPVVIITEPDTVPGSIVEDVVRTSLAGLIDPLAASVPVEVQRTVAAGGGRRTPRAMDYYAVGMGVMMLFFAAARGTESLLGDRRAGVYLRVRAGGVGRAGFMLGKLVGTVITAFLFMVVMAGSTRLLFGVSWGDPLGWALLTLGASLAAAGLNVVVMAAVRRPEVLDALSAALFQVLGFFGGSMMPIYIFPEVMNRISSLLPNRWMLDGYLALLSGGRAVDVLDETLALGLAAVVLFAVGWLAEGAAARAAGEV